MLPIDDTIGAAEEIGLTFVDNALESDDGEQSCCNGGGSNGEQNNQTKQTPGIASALAFEEEIAAGHWRARRASGHGC